eukprot:6213602-Pleurochrysis_carterae.AAC.2
MRCHDVCASWKFPAPCKLAEGCDVSTRTICSCKDGTSSLAAALLVLRPAASSSLRARTWHLTPCTAARINPNASPRAMTNTMRAKVELGRRIVTTVDGTQRSRLPHCPPRGMENRAAGVLSSSQHAGCTID